MNYLAPVALPYVFKVITESSEKDVRASENDVAAHLN